MGRQHVYLMNVHILYIGRERSTGRRAWEEDIHMTRHLLGTAANGLVSIYILWETPC